MEQKVVGIELDSIIKRGKLIAITNNSPTSYFIYKGRPMGYQHDLLARFAKEIGVQLEIKIVSSIPDAMDSLVHKKADILASGLTILGDRRQYLDFTLPITQTHQVLIQKKPEGHTSLNKRTLENRLLRDVTQLAGQEVYVEEGSSYYDRILSLQNEIGDTINIHRYSADLDMDSLMFLISSGEIKYAITEEYTAKFFLRYYPDLDIKTPISFNQNIAWATPKNSIALIDTINHWIEENQHTTTWAVIYNKYFKFNKNMNTRAYSGYNLDHGKISPYDNLIKVNAEKIGWDWRLIAAQISVESGFIPSKISWAGAQGLMQIMPITANSLNPNHTDPLSPSQNIEMGVKLDGILYTYWQQTITDSVEAIKFSLASYNIGKGHVFDAQRLAKKFGLNPLIWDGNVAVMIKKLSKSNYNRDPVVKHGYCRGLEAFNYVNRVFSLYQNYTNFEIPDS
jgi:membrane-bound lytic murein transglycosylase F